MGIELSRRGVLAAGAAAFALPKLLRPARAWAQEAAAAPLIYPRRVGELEIAAISDGYFDFDGPLFVNIDQAVLEDALRASYVDPAKPTRIGVTAQLVRDGDRTLLVDSGTADFFGPTLGRLPAALAALGVAPESVDAVLVTHLHLDHIGGLTANDAPAFPNATLHVSRADIDFWTDEGRASQAPEGMRGFFDVARATVAAYGDRVTPLTADGEVLPGATSVSLPGHTVGHAGFRLDSGDESILVFGDAANSAAVQFRHPSAGFTFDTDPVQAAETRARLFDMLATDRLLVAGTHMPFPGVGHVERSGDAYAWVPESWQHS
jgi:glyoxylase-like metal-dependent hydrolase (beta-lactamase superfamily II)